MRVIVDLPADQIAKMDAHWKELGYKSRAELMRELLRRWVEEKDAVRVTAAQAIKRARVKKVG